MVLPSILAEVDSVPTSQVLTHCVNVQIIIYVNFIFMFHTGNIQIYSRYLNIWEFSGSDKLARLLTCTCMREACTEYLEKLINTP